MTLILPPLCFIYYYYCTSSLGLVVLSSAPKKQSKHRGNWVRDDEYDSITTISMVVLIVMDLTFYLTPIFSNPTA